MKIVISDVCRAGHFYNGVSCEKCPRHFYQDEEGQKNCKPCDYGTKTIGNGSTSVDDCKGLLRLGSQYKVP